MFAYEIDCPKNSGQVDGDNHTPAERWECYCYEGSEHRSRLFVKSIAMLCHRTGPAAPPNPVGQR